MTRLLSQKKKLRSVISQSGILFLLISHPTFSTASTNGAPSFNWLQPAIGITQIVIGIIQALILAELTYYIFQRNAEQKISERQAAWFHKVVVDPYLPVIRGFFETATNDLILLAEHSVAVLRAAHNPADFDQVAKTAMSEFTSKMLPLRRALTDASAGFNGDLARQVGDRLLKLQEEISGWLEKTRANPDIDVRTSVPAILSRAQNDILMTFREFEFSTWGLSRDRTLWASFVRAATSLKCRIEEYSASSEAARR